MLEVDIDKILPVTEARDNFNKIVDEVEGTDHMYVLTKNGKPSAVIVGVNHLEKLTGKTADELTSIVEKKADETPVVEEVISPTVSASNVADGSKPSETESDSASDATIDVPIDNGGSASTENETAPQVEPAPAPTSSPGSATPASNESVEMPAEAGAPEVASNEPPLVVPTDAQNGSGPAKSDSDLFV